MICFEENALFTCIHERHIGHRYNCANIVGLFFFFQPPLPTPIPPSPPHPRLVSPPPVVACTYAVGACCVITSLLCCARTDIRTRRHAACLLGRGVGIDWNNHGLPPLIGVHPGRWCLYRHLMPPLPPPFSDCFFDTLGFFFPPSNTVC